MLTLFLLLAQTALPPPQWIPKAAPKTNQPYQPQALVPGGVVVPLWPANSPMLNAAKLSEPEVYTMSATVPGRVTSIVGIHNPSLEFHPVEKGLNTGAVVILVPGGGHNTLNVGNVGADLVSWLYNFGVNTVILRNRLRTDGYEPHVDAVNDALQALRLVRGYAKQWNLDPAKIGIMGFSAGAELATAASVRYPAFDASARPDFVGIIYPGPSPYAAPRPNIKQLPAPPVPNDVPPSFTASAGSGDQVHAVWAVEYYQTMLKLEVPNIEMHLYGRGVHGGAANDRGGMPFGTWQHRFIDWFRDLGFLEKPGVETRAARDVAAWSAQRAQGDNKK